MADTPTTTSETKQPLSSLGTFVVEFGKLNLNFYIQTLKAKVRGSFKQSVYTTDEGGAHTGIDMRRVPDFPGMRLTVNFRDGVAVVSDPLEGDKELMAKLNAVAKKIPAINPGDTLWRPVPQTKYALDPDRMQTLVKEVRAMHTMGKVEIIKGKIPSAEDMAKCDGRILNDVSSSNPRKAKYEDQVEAHMQKLLQAGVGDD